MTRSKVTAWASALLFCCCSSFKATAETPTVTTPGFGDDTYVHVPLQFGFPFYGEIFTNSWMHSNGVVSFLNPTTPMSGGNPGAWAFCCSGLDLAPDNVYLGSNFRYFIAPLWTDLYPTHESTFETQGTSQYQIYRWNNIAEISNFSNLNSFSLEIRPSGYIGVDYSLVNVANQIVSAGIVGDPTLGQMQSFFFGVPGSSINSWSVPDTPVDYCSANPLYSPQCAGYNEAYHDQQCSITPLYATTCFGYQQTYHDQQCLADPLYDSSCAGYQQAYHDQQCAMNPMHDSGCANYSTIKTATAPVLSSTLDAVTVNDDGTVDTQPALADDARVNAVLTQQTKTTSSESAPTSQPTVSTPVTTRRAPPRDPESQTDSEREFERSLAGQTAAVSAMALVPGFDAYVNSIIPDVMNREMQRQYNRPAQDNVRAQRQLNAASDRLHHDMMDQQYRR